MLQFTQLNRLVRRPLIRHVNIKFRRHYSFLGHYGSRARAWHTQYSLTSSGSQWRRCFGIDAVPTVLLPPLVFTGLVLTLWTYKCIMMVAFQNKIIYMPSVPPFSRSEKVEDYSRRCQPIVWQEHTVTTADDVDIKLLVGAKDEGKVRHVEEKSGRPHVVTIYFQGNASSLPPRLPFLSDALKVVERTEARPLATKYTIVAVSYRGFWTSRGRASQAGLELDAAQALQFVIEHFSSGTQDLRIVIWGQSIGAGIATIAAARYKDHTNRSSARRSPLLRGLLLETPFTSVKDMLVALYPQKWLPYRYLGVFLRNHLDSRAALQELGESYKKGAADVQRPEVLILQAENDELVPDDHAIQLESLCKANGLETERKVVHGALHTEVMAKGAGRSAVADFLTRIGNEQGQPR